MKGPACVWLRDAGNQAGVTGDELRARARAAAACTTGGGLVSVERAVLVRDLDGQHSYGRTRAGCIGERRRGLIVWTPLPANTAGT